MDAYCTHLNLPEKRIIEGGQREGWPERSERRLLSQSSHTQFGISSSHYLVCKQVLVSLPIDFTVWPVGFLREELSPCVSNIKHTQYHRAVIQQINSRMNQRIYRVRKKNVKIRQIKEYYGYF